MSFVQIVSALRPYGADVLLLAIGVTLLTSLLKKTLMKHWNGKVFVFLPFAVGIVLYAAFHMLVSMSWDPLTKELGTTLGGGFSCGSVATVYYLAYEKLARGKTALSPLEPLLDFLPEEKRKEAAKALYEGAKEKTEEERIAYFEEHLNEYADPPLDGEALTAYAVLLAEYLTSLEL